MQSYDLVAHLLRQRAFSRATFGPGPRTKGVIDHIKKELREIESDPRDITEWVDVILLALDGAWRCAEARNLPIEIVAGAIEAKQSKNERRDWPDWRTADPDKAIQHVRAPVEAASWLCCAPCITPDACRASCSCLRI
jgi:hypothetical protein